MKKVLVIISLIINSMLSSQGLNDVCTFGVFTVYAVGPNGVTLRSTNAGGSYSSGVVGSSSLYSVYCISANVWSVGGNGSYNKSADNGLSWSSQIIAGGTDLRCVYFIDSLTGFITGANGLILKSSDGGNNWISLSSGTINNLNKVKFINASTGYLLGENNFFAKTTNAGLNWNSVSLPVSANVSSIDNYNNTILLGLENSRLLISSNSGSNWNAITLNIYSKPSVKSTHLISDTSFVLMLESGSIWHTTNSGLTFSYVTSPMLSSISSCGFNGVRGYAVSSSHNAVL